MKLLHKTFDGNCLSQTHRVDAISPRISVCSGAANSFSELSLIVAGPKSERISSSIDYKRNSHSITKSSDRFDVLDLFLGGKELTCCMSGVFDGYSHFFRFPNLPDFCGHISC